MLDARKNGDRLASRACPAAAPRLAPRLAPGTCSLGIAACAAIEGLAESVGACNQVALALRSHLRPVLTCYVDAASRAATARRLLVSAARLRRRAQPAKADICKFES